VGNATSINHHQCVGASEVSWPPYNPKLLRLYHLSHSFSVTTECAVAESPSVARSTTPSDNPHYILWSIDVRYIEDHNQGFPEPVYVISILENFSRMLLASIISERQNLEAYLKVLFVALRNYGAPECIVTDGGGIFYAHRAMQIYEALGIHKERIDPGQPWQNYVRHVGVYWNSCMMQERLKAIPLGR